jgi:hypothetical protein
LLALPLLPPAGKDRLPVAAVVVANLSLPCFLMLLVVAAVTLFMLSRMLLTPALGSLAVEDALALL